LKLFAGGKELGDAESVQALVKAKPETVRVQFTNIDSDGFEVRRAVPNLVSLKDTDKSTMKSLFLEAAGKFKNVNFLGSRAGPQGKYQWQTYGQIAERVNHTIAGLLSLGAVKGDRVALWSINRPEWLIIDIVCCVFGFISVPLYDTLGPSACEYVLNHSEAKFLFVESNKYKEALLLKGKCKSVQHVISMEKDIPDSLSLKSLEAKGVAALKKGLSIQSKIHPSDILSICYTSGTTGDPKGVVISQGNVYSACIAMVEKAAEDLKVPGLVMISYLPLAHIYERVLELGTLALGQSVGYYSGVTFVSNRLMS
jgi:long-chain acyl-CoA synthetase